MTKETMIWQTLSMVIAGMTRKNEIPETVEAFEDKAVELAVSVLAYPDKDILKVLKTRDCTGFAEELSHLYRENK